MSLFFVASASLLMVHAHRSMKSENIAPPADIPGICIFSHMPRTTSDVVVIGAGVVGLMAARQIGAAGRSVTLIEARDRLGGRIHTLHDEEPPVPIERGAEFVHGEDESFRQLLREAGVAMYDVADEHWQFYSGRLTRLKDFWGDLGRVMKRLVPPPKEDRSFAEFLRQRCRGIPAKTRALARTYVEGFDAAFVDRVSAQSLAAEQEEEASQKQFRLLGGYGRLVDWLAAEVEKSNVRVLLSTNVFEIRWREGRIEVVAGTGRGGEGGTFRARCAVITLPLGVLKAGAVRFVPGLPEEKARALTKIEVSPVVKASMRFADPFWEKVQPPRSDGSLEAMTFIHSDEAVPTWWTQLPIRTPLLTGWAGGPAAQALSGKPELYIREAALRTLLRLLPITRRRINAMLEHTIVSDWQSDPFSRGAYSFLAVDGGDARRRLARPLRGTLFFAGEATSTDAPSTVPGAVETGRRVAKEVLRNV